MNKPPVVAEERSAGKEPAGTFDAPDAVSKYGLSPRELEVLCLLASGLADKQIAMALGLTKFTINKHIGAILTKMQVTSRTAAAVRAIREHLLPEDVAPSDAAPTEGEWATPMPLPRAPRGY